MANVTHIYVPIDPQRKADAERMGYTLWTHVLYEPMAEQVVGRLRRDFPTWDIFYDQMPDDTFVVWYRLGHAERVNAHVTPSVKRA